MVVGGTLFIVAMVIIAIWVIIETKRLKHKMLAIFLIGLILFSYFSMAVIFEDQSIDFKTVPGMITAGKLYFSWLGFIFVNMKQITTRAIQMDWGSNKTAKDVREEGSIFNLGKE